MPRPFLGECANQVAAHGAVVGIRNRVPRRADREAEECSYGREESSQSDTEIGIEEKKVVGHR